MIEGVANVDPARRERLVQLLDVDLDWSMKALATDNGAACKSVSGS